MFPALQRFFEAVECRTQAELAEFLGIKQSSISDAKKKRFLQIGFSLRCGKRNQTGWDTHRARRPYAAILRWDGNGCPPACTRFGNKATGGMHDGRTYGGNFSACIKNYQQKQTALAPLLVNRKGRNSFLGNESRPCLVPVEQLPLERIKTRSSSSGRPCTRSCRHR